MSPCVSLAFFCRVVSSLTDILIPPPMAVEPAALSFVNWLWAFAASVAFFILSVRLTYVIPNCFACVSFTSKAS